MFINLNEKDVFFLFQSIFAEKGEYMKTVLGNKNMLCKSWIFERNK